MLKGELFKGGRAQNGVADIRLNVFQYISVLYNNNIADGDEKILTSDRGVTWQWCFVDDGNERSEAPGTPPALYRPQGGGAPGYLKGVWQSEVPVTLFGYRFFLFTLNVSYSCTLDTCRLGYDPFWLIAYYTPWPDTLKMAFSPPGGGSNAV